MFTIKCLTGRGRNSMFAMWNTYKMFYKKKISKKEKKFNLYLNIWFLVLILLAVLIFWYCYE